MASSKSKLSNRKAGIAPDVAAIRKMLRAFYDATDGEDRQWGSAKWGIYLFYDFDGEPIYVGQTCERLRSRIGRHLTNQRTDAVAMFVLDPFEVESIEVWPFWDLGNAKCPAKDAKAVIDAAEYAVYLKAVGASKFKAVLNEKMPPKSKAIKMPPSYKASIIPDDLREGRSHSDVRIARRASTIANLARVIAERGDVNPGLRHTLVVQARRLEWLASARVEELGAPYPEKKAGTETGERIDDDEGGQE